MQSIARISMLALAIFTWCFHTNDVFARGGLGGFHGQGYHIGGVGVPYGGASMGPAASTVRTRSYGAASFTPSIGSMGTMGAAGQPFTYSLGGIGGFHYNPSYANPYTYHNPYMYHPYTNPYQVPFTHAF